MIKISGIIEETWGQGDISLPRITFKICAKVGSDIKIAVHGSEWVNEGCTFFPEWENHFSLNDHRTLLCFDQV